MVGAERDALGRLPEWDLGDLYPGRDSPELAADLEALKTSARAFQARYRGGLAGLDGAALGAAVAEYEALQEVGGRISSYAELTRAGNLADPEIARFFQTVQEKINAAATELLFFTLELNRLDDDSLKEKAADPALARYRPWLRDVRAMRPHQLSDDLEKLLLEKSVAGRNAWTRLFDETTAELRFPIGGKELTEAEAMHLLSSPDGAARKEAALSIGAVLGKNARVFALVTNTLAKDKEIEDRWRAFPRPISARNLSNYVEDDVVDALIAAVRASYPSLSHRYYRLNARWIDAPARAGKSPGAFAHPTVPGVHPYLLLNYQGRSRDVMTLAHELGHGCHQVLAAGQGLLMADTPLTLAETASVFGEMLTFRALLAGERDPARRRAMIAGKVEDMLNTVVRQIAFVTFETRVHDERKEGELTADRLAEIWLDVQRESLGPAIALDGDYRWYWSYIPHFIHSPFYVYAYAFGDCLVNSLYAVYEDAHEGFAARYLDLLRAGGSLRHRELLAPFGLDAADPEFWSKGLGVIAGFIDELESIG